MRWLSGIRPTPTGAHVRPELPLFWLLNMDRNIPEYAMYSFWRGPHASTREEAMIGQESTTSRAGREHVPDTREPVWSDSRPFSGVLPVPVAAERHIPHEESTHRVCIYWAVLIMSHRSVSIMLTTGFPVYCTQNRAWRGTGEHLSRHPMYFAMRTLSDVPLFPPPRLLPPLNLDPTPPSPPPPTSSHRKLERARLRRGSSSTTRPGALS